MKKIILAIAVIATAAIAGWHYQQNKQNVVLSDLAMENVDALAKGEVIVGVPCAQVCTNCWCVYFDPYEEVEGEPYI